MEISNEDIFNKLLFLEKKFDEALSSLDQLNQPIINSKAAAAKYIKMGKDKFGYLLSSGKITVYRNMGGIYFLKSELLEGLKKERYHYDFFRKK